MGTGLRIIRAINIGLCLLGVLVFGALFTYVQASPEDFERRSQSFVTQQVAQEFKELNERLSPGDVDKVKSAAAFFSDKLSERIVAVEAMVQAGAPEFIAAVISAMCNIGCERRAALEAAVERAFQDHLAHLNVGIETLRGMVEEKYHDILAQLRRDLAIFFGSNLVVMVLALGIAAFYGRAARHLLPIASILTVSVLLAGYWYVFGQDWVISIVFSHYVGWSYSVYLGLLCFLLWDIALNRARITTQLLNWFSELIGAPFSLLPC